jgi:Uma2 family endonuclease
MAERESILMPTMFASAATNGHRPTMPREFIWRLSLEQYHRMINEDILTSADPVELLEGWLVQKMPKKPIHRRVTRRLRQMLEALLAADWFVDCQEPVTLIDSEPEPDISVVRGGDEDYRDRHPQPADIGMLAEVADTTLARDQRTKKRIYARSRVLIYWIVNVAARRIEVYEEPTGPAKHPTYRRRTDYPVGTQAPVVLDGKKVGSIRVSKLFA